MTPTKDIPSGLDTSVAHSARIYDYLLGGKDNFAADRAAADMMVQAYPEIVSAMRANRKFLARAVRFLAADQQVRQFLDIGTGIPTANNTHEVAQAVRPSSRVVYVDSDPVVLVHARALLTSSRDGATAYVEADLREPRTILARAADLLDFSQPVALMLVAILHFIPEEDNPYGVVKTLVDALPSGSFLTLSHPAADVDGPQAAEAAKRFNDRAAQRATLRTKPEVSRFFDGLDLVEPGLVLLQDWRPDDQQDAGQSNMWAGVGRKP
jgi:hypothetical protein